MRFPLQPVDHHRSLGILRPHQCAANLIVGHADRKSDLISVSFGCRPLDPEFQHFIKRTGAFKVAVVSIDVNHAGDVHFRGLPRLEVVRDGAAPCSIQSMVVRKVRAVAVYLASPSINCIAVVDNQFRSGDVLGLIRQQEKHHIGDILGFTDAQRKAGFFRVLLCH